MVENSVITLNSKGFLVPLTSSVNLIFSDPEKLQSEIEGLLLAPMI